MIGAAHCADRLNLKREVDRTGVLERHRAVDVRALCNRLFQADQHEMNALRLQFDGFARLHF